MSDISASITCHIFLLKEINLYFSHVACILYGYKKYLREWPKSNLISEMKMMTLGVCSSTIEQKYFWQGIPKYWKQKCISNSRQIICMSLLKVTKSVSKPNKLSMTRGVCNDNTFYRVYNRKFFYQFWTYKIRLEQHIYIYQKRFDRTR